MPYNKKIQNTRETDVFVIMDNIKHKNANIIVDNSNTLHTQTIATDDEFNDIILPRISEIYERIVNVIKRHCDIVDKKVIDFIRIHLINGENERIKDVRNILYDFVCNKLQLIVGRIKNKFVYKKSIDNDTMYEMSRTIYDSIMNNDEFNIVLENIQMSKSFEYYKTDDIEDTTVPIKNIANIMDTILPIILDTIEYPIQQKLSLNSIRLSSLIAYYILYNLYMYFQNNMFDSQDIMKRFDEDREVRNQNEINKYSKDDEIRALQKTYRDLAVPEWSSVFDRTLNKPEQNSNEEREDFENFNGQNDDNIDENNDEDTDFVRGEEI